jgi:hypothetical protein
MVEEFTSAYRLFACLLLSLSIKYGVRLLKLILYFINGKIMSFEVFNQAIILTKYNLRVSLSF